MASSGTLDCGGQTGGSGAHHGNPLPVRRGRGIELDLAAGPGIDQARRDPVGENVVETGLIAGNTGVDLIRASPGGLIDELGVGQHRTRHGNHIGAAFGQDLLRQFRSVDPVGGDDRDFHHFLEAPCTKHPGAARHVIRDRRNRCFVPAVACVEDICAGCFHLACQIVRLRGPQTPCNEIDGRDAVHHDLIRTQREPHPARDLHWKAATVLQHTAPLVSALVRTGRGELIQQVALGAHQLNAIETRLARQQGALDEVIQRGLNVGVREHPRNSGIDRRANCRHADNVVVFCIASGMQYLQQDLGAMTMYFVGNRAQVAGLLACAQHRRARLEHPRDIGRKPARDDQCNAAGGPGTVKGGLPPYRVVHVLEAGVHGAHHHAVA